MDGHAGMKRKRGGHPQNSFVGGPSLFNKDDAPSHKSIKNRIRSIKRLLAKADLPKAARKDKTRMMAKLEEEYKASKFQAAEFKQGAKYHAVKFFERQKITRAISKIEKMIEALSSDASTRVPVPLADLGAAAVLHPDLCEALVTSSTTGTVADQIERADALLIQLQADRLYTKWYPRHLRYIGLLPAVDAKGKGRSGGKGKAGGTPADSSSESDSESESGSESGSGSDRGEATGTKKSSTGARMGKGKKDVVPPPPAELTPEQRAAKASKRASKKEAMMAWALANAHAGDYLRQPPGEATAPLAAVVGKHFVKRSNEKAAGAGDSAPGAASSDEHDSESDDDDDDDGDDGMAPASKVLKAHAQSRGAVDAVKSTRGTTATSTATSGGSASHKPQGALPVEPTSGSRVSGTSTARAPLPAAAGDESDGDKSGEEDSEDDFFTSAATTGAASGGGSSSGNIVFREEVPGEMSRDLEDGGDPSGGKWYGPRTAAGRYEREHMNAPRYRDASYSRAGGGGTVPANGGGVDASPDLSHLSDRKRRRAERGLKFAPGADGTGGSGVGRFTEAFFGTEADTGAVLRSQQRVQRSAAKEAAAGGYRSGGGGGYGAPAHSSYKPTHSTFPQSAAPSAGSGGIGANKSCSGSKAPALSAVAADRAARKAKPPGSHMKFIEA